MRYFVLFISLLTFNVSADTRIVLNNKTRQNISVQRSSKPTIDRYNTNYKKENFNNQYKTRVLRQNNKVIDSRLIKTRNNRKLNSRKINNMTNISRASSNRQSKIINPFNKNKSTSKNIFMARTAISKKAENNLKNYKICKETYYKCMDEFCANKNKELKRCACSSRLNEFDDIKKDLIGIEKKMLDFNQRLLTVNMDVKDASAINKATKGELASQTQDESPSKQILNEITNKLKQGSKDNDFNRGLTAISLDINTDSAFEDIDSFMGQSATLKEGIALYKEALPICNDIAKEVCDDTSLSIIESGYNAAIEQDCNSVFKAYENKKNSALKKIHESGALLDISRLNNYQKQNKDDILTCKKKMLNLLHDPAICSKDLSKCLDYSGKYVNQATGKIVLSNELYKFSSDNEDNSGFAGIKKPKSNISWKENNTEYVKLLDTKKKYLQPAMESCKNISGIVWEEFVEDALKQLKLSQQAKIEETKQNCINLTSKCLTDSNKLLTEFDSRSLSLFGIISNKLTSGICKEIKDSCSALFKNTENQKEWSDGFNNIDIAKSYADIVNNCMEVGRSCILKNCSSYKGKFALCDYQEASRVRYNIFNQVICYEEVKKCVSSSSSSKECFDNNNNNIMCKIFDLYKDQLKVINDDFKYPYTSLYDGATNNKYDSIIDIISDRIWGFCSNKNSIKGRQIINFDKYNKNNTDVLDINNNILNWFASNTNTNSKDSNSCSPTICANGHYWDGTKCKNNIDDYQSYITMDGIKIKLDELKKWFIDENNKQVICIKDRNQNNDYNKNTEIRITTESPEEYSIKDSFGNCCSSGAIIIIEEKTFCNPFRNNLSYIKTNKKKLNTKEYMFCTEQWIEKKTIIGSKVLRGYNCENGNYFKVILDNEKATYYNKENKEFKRTSNEQESQPIPYIQNCKSGYCN